MLIPLLLLLVGCGSDSWFVALPPSPPAAAAPSGPPKALKPVEKGLTPASAPPVEERRRLDLDAVLASRTLRATAPAMHPVPPDPAGSSATEAWEDPTGDLRRERFLLEQGTPVADFLFVVDNSVSMRKVLDRVDAAFKALERERPFPAGARVAVMSTLPAALDDPSRVHPAVRHPEIPYLEPGYQRLVDREGIQRIRDSVPEISRFFPYTGCAAWFAPEARGPDNVSCLTAAIQSTHLAVGVEAGLTAVAQLLKAQGDRPLFRPGAAVHVIFVSDTHDPGLPAGHPELDGLVEARPGALALRLLVEQTQQVASFRIHAIAPASSACGEKWAHIGPVYFDAAASTGGQARDLCSDPDYAALIREIGQRGGERTDPVLTLGAPASDRAIVRLSGSVTAFSPSPDGRSIRVPAARPGGRDDVEITYLRRGAAGWLGELLREPAPPGLQPPRAPSTAVRPAHPTPRTSPLDLPQAPQRPSPARDPR